MLQKMLANPGTPVPDPGLQLPGKQLSTKQVGTYLGTFPHFLMDKMGISWGSDQDNATVKKTSVVQDF